MDIRRTSDGELVRLHGEQVDRSTNGRGRVSELTLSDIRKLDAGGGESPPTLNDMLKAASGRIGLILELKTRGLAYDVRNRPCQRLTCDLYIVPTGRASTYPTGQFRTRRP